MMMNEKALRNGEPSEAAAPHMCFRPQTKSCNSPKEDMKDAHDWCKVQGLLIPDHLLNLFHLFIPLK